MYRLQWLGRLRLAGVLAPVLVGIGYWICARSCAYRHDLIWSYFGYLGLYVWLPGLLLLSVSLSRQAGWLSSVTLGLPLGFAWEALLFSCCAALGWRDEFRIVASGAGLVLFMLVGFGRRWQRLRLGVPRLGSFEHLAISAVLLLGLIQVAARMYARLPLFEGQLLYTTHHDWVYLLSRAQEIAHRWPFQDPSLSGTPLSYHYLFMVHAAAAHSVTAIELPLVMFRFVQVPLLFTLLLQAFALGRIAGGSNAAGLVSAALLLNVGELSLQTSTSGGLFGTLFLEWLFVSPTFFFGMIYMGAVLLWIQCMGGLAKVRKIDWVLLFALAVAATGAKGTVLVPMVLAASLWAVVSYSKTKAYPWRLAAKTTVIGFGFLVAYDLILRAWSGDDTKVHLLAFWRITEFWLANAMPWQQSLVSLGVPEALAKVGVAAVCALVIFIGNTGVFLWGLAFGASRWQQPAMAWLMLVAATCLVSGQVLFLESHAEIYLYLPARLPLAVLTGAAVVATWRNQHFREFLARSTRRGALQLAGLGAGALGFTALYIQGIIPWWLAIAMTLVTAAFLGDLGQALSFKPSGFPGHSLAIWTSLRHSAWAAVFMLLAAVQMNYQLLGARDGWQRWFVLGTEAYEADLVVLHEGLDWVRRETPVDSVLLASLFIPANTDPEALSVVDRTTLDKHYYYSALSGRRLWVEGPAYLRDYPEALRRMQLTNELLRSGNCEPLLNELRQPCYLVIDRSLPVTLARPIDGSSKVFENSRLTIYKLPNRAG